MKKILSILKAFLFVYCITMINYILLYHLERSLPPDTVNFNLIRKIIFIATTISSVIGFLNSVYGTDKKNDDKSESKTSEYKEKLEIKEEKNEKNSKNNIYYPSIIFKLFMILAVNLSLFSWFLEYEIENKPFFLDKFYNF